MSAVERMTSAQAYGGGLTKQVLEGIAQLQIVSSPAAQLPQKGAQLEDRIFRALSDAKIQMAARAVHLKPEDRNRLVHQLDSLHDVEEWDESSSVLSLPSFLTFVRFVIFSKPMIWPGLGIKDGRLLGSWGRLPTDRLILEFFPDDEVHWLLTLEVNGIAERSVGKTDVRLLRRRLASYPAEHWMGDAPAE